MRKSYIKVKAAFLAVTMLFMASCGEEWLNINEDPIQPSEAQLDLLLPAIQGAMAWGLNDQINEGTSIYIQHFYGLAFSRYEQSTASYSESWEELFAGSLQDLEVFIPTSEQDSLYLYSGVGKLHKAYIYSLIIDMWGAAPYSEAFQGLANQQPQFQSGEAVYDSVFALIDEGLADFARDESGIVPSADMMYGGDAEAYVAQYTQFANTLLLKLYNQIRLYDETRARTGITALLDADSSFIASNDDDFQFNYGTNQAPLNRHPLYVNSYASGKTYYMNNYFMNALITNNDPRLPYYIYRQDLSDPEGDNLPCETVDCPYGYQGNGYTGRDHGDPSGLPPDDAIRAVFGVYPVGGKYDAGQGDEAEVGDGGQGAGILPLLTNFMHHFILAEAALTLGVSEDPRVQLEEGIRASMSKVVDYSVSVDEAAANNYDADVVNDGIEAYVADVLDRYDNASASGKLDVVMTEAHKALFGNGFEAYNNYRRTGYPSALPPSISPFLADDEFVLRLPMSVAEIQGNSNAPTELVTTPVFWDIN
ncbi:SusD/RagB family nutrient-binding outer membrane lipoprotein [Roseivirga sp. BDSF3-8]|uniref:SusD/RagB family nutrient-binding outer membrane lipoprotein n=1 Tax=Roseivirga sp. BDSF3-8 TaxID=3241598 RepID=UPI0035327DE9